MTIFPDDIWQSINQINLSDIQSSSLDALDMVLQQLPQSQSIFVWMEQYTVVSIILYWLHDYDWENV